MAKSQGGKYSGVFKSAASMERLVTSSSKKTTQRKKTVELFADLLTVEDMERDIEGEQDNEPSRRDGGSLLPKKDINVIIICHLCFKF